MDKKSGWDVAMRFRFCYRRVCDNHRDNCHFNGKCGTDACSDPHNNLLNYGKEKMEQRRMRMTRKEEAIKCRGGTPIKVSMFKWTRLEQCITSKESTQASLMALRMVPVKLRNGTQELAVNALFDDGSIKAETQITQTLGPRETNIQIMQNFCQVAPSGLPTTSNSYAT